MRNAETSQDHDSRKRSQKRSGNEKEPNVFRYRDKRTDDFSGIRKETRTIDAKYPYLHKNPFWNAAAFFVYHVIMIPFAFLYSKLRFRLKIVNRRAMRKSKGKGCFLYGNHTLLAGDAFFPNLVAFPKRSYVVVHADNVSTPGTENYVQMCGAIPIPTTFDGMRPFLGAIETRIRNGNCVVIYPEAHVWPYYTGIRPFDSTSFRYPVRYGGAVFASTVTYQKRRRGKVPKVTLFVDGPFTADPALSPREQEKQLRDAVYEAMCRRAAENSTYSPFLYLKEEPENAGEEAEA